MINITNIFKPNSKAVMKFTLAIKALVATIASAAFVQDDPKFAFYALVAGGTINFILYLLPPPGDEANTPAVAAPAAGNKTLFLVGLIVSCTMLSGCWSQRPQLVQKDIHTDTTVLSHSVKDTTITTYKAVDFHVAGAKVQSAINIDSLFHVALMAKDQRISDSIANLKLELKYKADSIAALKAGKALPAAPVLSSQKPVIKYFTDPQTKAQLAYWIDTYGKFQITCESKDQTITLQQAQIKVLEKDVSDKTRTITDLQSKQVTVFKTPAWAWWALAISASLNIITALIVYLIKK